MLDVIHSCNYTFFPYAVRAKENWASVLHVVAPDGLPLRYTESARHPSEAAALDAARHAAHEIATEIRESWLNFDTH